MAESALEKREIGRLIGSDKVEGTAVHDRNGVKIGTVKRVMIDKYTGKVAYAVMSFGGFLGMGESYHPLPWRALTYDTRLGGYVVDIDKDQLAGAPQHRADEDAFADPAFGSKVDAYYRTAPTS